MLNLMQSRLELDAAQSAANGSLQRQQAQQQQKSSLPLRWKVAVGGALALSGISLCTSVYSIFIGIAASSSFAAAGVKAAGVLHEMSAAAPQAALAVGDMQAQLQKMQREYISPTDVPVLKEAVRRSGIIIDPDGAPVAMFSDPLCPSCRKFEASIAKDGYKQFVPLVIPVAFKPGSMDVAAGILCAKDPVKAWKDVMAMSPDRVKPPAEPCDEGRKIIEQNNADFAKMRLMRRRLS